MTVTYTAKVATSSIGCFLKLLFRWRGSVYKLVWRELLIFIVLYYILGMTYRFAMDPASKARFEIVAKYCRMYNDLIPLAFVLGFFVSVVLSRWWEQFNKIPWPDRMALFVTASIQGDDERGRLMRRSIMRYLCLSFVITLSSISPPVKKRFPTFMHMTEAGFMQPSEQKILEGILTPHNKYFIPLVWSTSLVSRARKEGRIKDDFAVKTLVDEINDFRGCLGSLFNYDWINVPLVYTQVVTLATYSFFLSCLIGRQFTEVKSDVYVPVFTFLQFLFYMGWLKVAETLVNPFGEDDDDFDINQVIDRNLQVSYLVVDEMHQEHPELIKDPFWDETEFDLPYTQAAEQFRTTSPFIGSAMDINLSPKLSNFVAPSLSSIIENTNDELRTDPTDIPLGQPHPFTHRNLVPNNSNKQKLLNKFFRRSASRKSNTTADSESMLGSTTRLKRRGSLTSKGSEDRPASPTIPSTQGDIFNMEDLSDQESELAFPESFTSQSTHLIDTGRAKIMKSSSKDTFDPSSSPETVREATNKRNTRLADNSKESLDKKTTSVGEDLSKEGATKQRRKKFFKDLHLPVSKPAPNKEPASLPATPVVSECPAGAEAISMTNMNKGTSGSNCPSYQRTTSLVDTQLGKTLYEQV